MRRLLRFRLLWAILFGLITAGLLYVYLQQIAHQAATASQVPVVVAVGAVDAGTELSAGQLTVVQWPQSAALPGRISTVAAAVGQIVTVPLTAGEPVLQHQLHPREEVGDGGQVPLGMRLFTIAVDDTLSIGYRLRKGDKVDVMRVYKDSKAIHAEMVLQSVEVYALGEEPTSSTDRNGEPRTVTLVLTPQDSLMVALLAEEKSVRLSLRPSGDKAQPAVTPVSRPTE